jgi:hypothetical protein
VLIVGVSMNLASCASAPPYDPNHLSADQLSLVGKVCHTVMGFEPSEALTDNLWPGNPDTAASTNSYRGCIATLSNSLKRAAAARASRQAEQGCLSKGLATDSSDFALCVLTAEETPPPETQIRLASLTDTPLLISMTPAYPRHVHAAARKEQLACAAIGLDPIEDAFSGCVQGLTNVMSAGIMNEAYRN